MGLTTHATVLPLRLRTGYGQRVLDALRSPLRAGQNDAALRDVDTAGHGDYGKRILAGAFRRVGLEDVLAHLLNAPWGDDWDMAVLTVDDEESVAVAQVAYGRVELTRHNRVDDTVLRTGFSLADWRAGTVPPVDWRDEWPRAGE